MNIKKCYQILEVSPTASHSEIKRAYRRLALKYHPDKNPGQETTASRRFTAITRAYSILMDHHASDVRTSADAIEYFKRHFYSLVQRIRDDSSVGVKVEQEECDFFFRYQIEEVRMVQRGTVEARRIINLMRKAMTKGYDPSTLLEEHAEFFQKHGFMHIDDAESSRTEQQVKELIWQDPTSAESHYQLGVLYERRGLQEKALREYQLASYMDPKRLDIKHAIRRLRTQPATHHPVAERPSVHEF